MNTDMEIDADVVTAIAGLVKDGSQKVEKLTVTDPRDKTEATVLAIHETHGIRIEGVSDLFTPYRTAPVSRKGKAEITDIQSFVALVNRYKTPDSAIFADIKPGSAGLLAVIDYNDRVNVPDDEEDSRRIASPRFGQHRIGYKFPISEEWEEWISKNKKPFSQGEFASFVENRILDVLPAPVFGSGEISPADAKLKEILDLLGGSFASPKELMKLSRGLSVHETSRVEAVTNLNSGEGSITFASEHQDENGEKLTVPNLFTIGVPVFKSGEAYRVVVRLRYRKSNGGVTWFYELYRHDCVFDDAVKGAIETAKTGTGLPIYSGSPEA